MPGSRLSSTNAGNAGSHASSSRLSTIFSAPTAVLAVLLCTAPSLAGGNAPAATPLSWCGSSGLRLSGSSSAPTAPQHSRQQQHDADKPSPTQAPSWRAYSPAFGVQALASRDRDTSSSSSSSRGITLPPVSGKPPYFAGIQRMGPDTANGTAVSDGMPAAVASPAAPLQTPPPSTAGPQQPFVFLGASGVWGGAAAGNLSAPPASQPGCLAVAGPPSAVSPGALVFPGASPSQGACIAFAADVAAVAAAGGAAPQARLLRWRQLALGPRAAGGGTAAPQANATADGDDGSDAAPGWGFAFHDAGHTRRVFLFPTSLGGGGGGGAAVVASVDPAALLASAEGEAVAATVDADLTRLAYSSQPGALSPEGLAAELGGGDAAGEGGVPEWGTPVRRGSAVVLPPMLSPHVVVFGMRNRAVLTFNTTDAVNKVLPGCGGGNATAPPCGAPPALRKWSGAAVSGYSVYFAPHDLPYVLRCDLRPPPLFGAGGGSPQGGEGAFLAWDSIDSSFGLDCAIEFEVPLEGAWGGSSGLALFSDVSLLEGGHLVFAPHSAGAVVLHDVEERVMSCLELPAGLVPETGGAGFAGSCPLQWSGAASESVLLAPRSAAAFAEVGRGIPAPQGDPRVHESDGGATVAVVIFVVLFGVVAVAVVMYFHSSRGNSPAAGESGYKAYTDNGLTVEKGTKASSAARSSPLRSVGSRDNDEEMLNLSVASRQSKRDKEAMQELRSRIASIEEGGAVNIARVDSIVEEDSKQQMLD